MSEPRALISDDRIRRALTALGLREVRSIDPSRQVSRDVLVGALLALAELAVGPADSTEVDGGYWWALNTVARGDETTAATLWASLAKNRLHLVADGMSRPHDAALPLADVAGPAVLAAANALMLLHHTAPSPGLVAEALVGAQANLARAAKNLADLRKQLADDGYDL